MSAICGIYHSNGRLVMPEVGMDMMKEFSSYHADAVRTWHKEQVFFGCHAQFITPESVGETLPYHDDLKGLTITADAIIDNRVELCSKLAIDDARLDGMPDSLLILEAYRKWGQDCPEQLVGDFAFAIWDQNRQELFCAVDHTGTRTLYYYQAAGFFAFSTLIKPLFVLPEISKKHNDIWIADFLAIPSVMHQQDSELTLYKNIYLLPAGHKMMVRSDGIVKQVYWQVERQPKLKFKSDGEYEEAFREIFGEAVRCRLRCTRPVGVMMSGGLDSSSVACMAARELDKNNQRLMAFSAVPMVDYRNWLPDGILADETQYIEAVRAHSPNIDVMYCRAEGKHSLSDTDRLSSILEQPYKIITNIFWLDGIVASAQKRNVGVILSGNAGNTTISWGYIQPYLISLFRGGRWFRLFKESWAFSRRYKEPLRVLWGLIRTVLVSNIPKKLYRSKKHDWVTKQSPINPDFACKTAVQERLCRVRHDPSLFNRLDAFESRQMLLAPEYFSHGGVFTTKLSLAYGVALRDPTMDKRVIEFCLSVPESQYVHNGRERLLLRRAMAGIVPDKILLNETVHGRQGADWVQRLQSCWLDLATEIRNIGAREAEREYLDIPKIGSELTKIGVLNDDMANDAGLRMLIRSLIVSRFLRNEEHFS